MPASEVPTSAPDPLKKRKESKKRKKHCLLLTIQGDLEERDLDSTSKSAKADLYKEKKHKQHDATFGASNGKKTHGLCKIAGSGPLTEKHSLPSTGSEDALGENHPSNSILEDRKVDLNRIKKKKGNFVSSNNNLMASKEEILSTGMVCKVHDVTLEETSNFASHDFGNSENALQIGEQCEQKTTTKKKRRSRNGKSCNAFENKARENLLEEGIPCTQNEIDSDSIKEDNAMTNHGPLDIIDSDLNKIELKSAEVKDTSSSLEDVQNGLSCEINANNSNEKSLSKHAEGRNQRKKGKQIVCEDEALNDITKCDLLDDNIVQEHVDDTSKDQPTVNKFDTSVEENTEVSLTYCKEGLPSSTSESVIDGVSLLDPSDMSFPLHRAPTSHARRKLLILDLNGLLVDIVSFEPYCHKPDMKVAGKSAFKRPFCDEFLKFCFETFDVGVWSSRKESNVRTVVDFLMGDLKHKLLFCWDQSKCTLTGFNTVENRHKPLFLKELRKLWDKLEPDLPWEKGEFTPSNTLLLDDSPHKALRNPPYTAIFPSPYYFRNEDDNSLGPGGDLRVYLEGIIMTDSIPHYVKQHPFGQRAITDANPSWKYYLQVIDAKNTPLPN